MIKNIFTTTFFIISVNLFYSQKVIDKIVAVVGEKAILLSDIENQKIQAIQQGIQIEDETDCMILNEIMFQNLLRIW